MKLTKKDASKLGVYARHPDRVKTSELVRMADHLLAAKPGPGAKPASSCPVLSQQDLDRLQQTEIPTESLAPAYPPPIDWDQFDDSGSGLNEFGF